MWMIIVGIVLVLCAIGAVIYSLINTPDNLMGFYGGMFWLIAAVGIVGGIVLAVNGFITL